MSHTRAINAAREDVAWGFRTMDDGVADSPPPTLETLPADACFQILRHLDPLDLCCTARASKALRAAAHDDGVWASLHRRRTGVRPSEDAFSVFRRRWQEEMGRIETASDLSSLDANNGADVAEPQAATRSPSAGPIVWGASAPRRPEAHGVDAVTFSAVVRRIIIGLRAQPEAGEEEMSVDWLVDWLRTEAASLRPVGCLAIVAAMQGEPERWHVPYLTLVSSSHNDEVISVSIMPRETGGGAERRAAQLRAARERLLTSPWSPPASLHGRVTLRWSTWSQLRDCRGFRARDDKHRRSASLLELAREAHDDAWLLLARGESNDVRELRVAGERS